MNQVNDNTIDNKVKVLRKIISLSNNEKINTIIPIDKGIKVIYKDRAINVKCEPVCIAPIMWYFSIDDHYSKYVDHDTKYDIIKNLE